MSYRIFRYGGDGTQKIYQSAEVEIETYRDGRECRIPRFVDTEKKEWATIFPGDCPSIASFIRDWFDVYCEEVEDEEDEE